MKIYSLVIMLCLLLAGLPAGAADGVESPRECAQCGMDRGSFARGRVLVTYSDGTTSGFCSLHCAAESEKHHPEKTVTSFKVADYVSSALIDAKSATWVVGGNQRGAMTAVPKWAFASEDEARKFIAVNGGKTASFDEALKAAESELEPECCRKSRHAHHGPGGQLLFNPAFGDDIYHTHPAGSAMVNYRYSHTEMSGLRAGTSKVPIGDAVPTTSRYGYMMASTRMSMDMHMVMAMYGITDRLTLMGMTAFLDNSMEMVMDMGMGMGRTREPTMRTSGLGDTELRGVYKLSDALVGSLGVSFPTGNITQQFQTMGNTFRAPYDMQLGSGTYDLKPALTYNAVSDDGAWNLGGQASYTFHPGKNEAGYSLGDSVKATGWLQRAFGPVSSWLRLSFNSSGRIHGEDGEIRKSLQMAPSPDADPANYGGERLDGLVGVSYAIGPVSIGVEGGIPLYQRVNGLQLETDWLLTAGAQLMF
ncbi:nitrous oxide reductase accessory protein NosL [Geomesophilobacter sediminis]|uniref:Nitrous oxide reductase accessory protein NosL n=1 Tax=Geomesophilobacter sediminis TaxID=2798584 RepID=A0A8J7J6E4_9BACT|nr:nitrous oxide reductase accessory protein NosL [Geomesophilobacter sediminis]MBJ6724346.1 nitrous oxide reductase accessory protein NosL [Geomesophilobacter sediminis]